MQWIAPSEKDTATDALEKRLVTEHKKNPSSELAIHRQEKVVATVALCRINLAMNGFEGDINVAITYYNDLYNSIGPTLPLPMCSSI